MFVIELFNLSNSERYLHPSNPILLSVNMNEYWRKIDSSQLHDRFIFVIELFNLSDSKRYLHPSSPILSVNMGELKENR